MDIMDTATAKRISAVAAGTQFHSHGATGYHQPPSLQGMACVADSGSGDDALESTIELLARAKQGEERAVEQLFQRCLPSLRRWARGRLPYYARDLADTQDVVQEAILSTLHRLNSFESRHQGALQAYLRQAVVNRIRDEIRRVGRRPIPTELDDQQVDGAPSPLEHAIGREGLERYEAALQKLRPADREAIVARMELQQSYDEVAVALGKPNANAARVAVTRALAKLIDEMERER
jgi:RNA polymerase sigma-70 factor (ECF subfamily)